MKILQNISRSKLIALAVCALIIFLRFCVLCDTYLSINSSTPKYYSQTEEITAENDYTFTIDSEDSSLQSFGLMFMTYDRINTCNLTITLTDSNNHVIQKYEMCANLLMNKTLNTFYLDKPVSNSEGSTYAITISSDGCEGNSIALCLDENNQPCCRLTYRHGLQSVFTGINGRHTLAFCLLAILLFAALLLFSDKAPEKVFLAIWVLMGIMILNCCTIFNVPDEEHHFYRAYEISQGHMLSVYDEENSRAGRQLPLDVDLNLLENNWESYEAYKSLTLTDNAFMSFDNTALYCPVSYLPQSLGIAIGRLFTNRISLLVYMGRIFNFAAITLLLYLAIKLLPFGKEAAVFIALMPMNIYESMSLAPDGMIVAITMFMIAYVLHLNINQKTPLKIQQYVLLYVLAIFISLYKMIYLPFVLVYFIIPAHLFGKENGLRNKTIHAVIVAAASASSAFFWLKCCDSFLLTAGTNPSYQTAYMLHHPVKFVMISLRTVFDFSAEWIMEMIGSTLNERNAEIGTVFTLIYLIVLIFAFISAHKVSEKSFDKKNRIFNSVVFIAIILSITGLTFVSLYMQWTAPYLERIMGIQGRYFISLLLPLFMACKYITAKKDSEDASASLAFIPLSLCVSINIIACVKLLFVSIGWY